MRVANMQTREREQSLLVNETLSRRHIIQAQNSDQGNDPQGRRQRELKQMVKPYKRLQSQGHIFF